MKSALRWISAAWVAAGVSAAWSGPAFADVKIGVTVSATGPAASLGIPEKNTIALLPKEIAGPLLDGLKQRHAKALEAISRTLSARADYYRAYGQYVAFLSSELGSFKVVAGQFIFPLQRTVERYNTAAQAMTSAGKRVTELETDLKRQEQPLPEEWMQLTGGK